MRNFLIILFLFIPVFTQEVQADFTFKGQIDIPKKELELAFDIPQSTSDGLNQEIILDDNGSIFIKAQQMIDGEYHVSFDVGHLHTPQFYFSGNIEGIFKLLDQEDSNGGLIQGHWWGDKPSVNFETVEKFSGEFKVANQRLYLKSFALGDILGQGMMELNSPYKMDFDVNVSSMQMKDFLSFWMKNKEDQAQGQVSGKIKVSGGLDKLSLQGKLESFNGFVRQLQFNSIYLDVEGIYPNLKINQESTISKSDGLSYSFEGLVNLADKENFKNQLKKLKISPLVNATESGMEWTIKRMAEGDSSTELKYLLRKNENVQSSTDAGMLGVERSIKF